MKWSQLIWPMSSLSILLQAGFPQTDFMTLPRPNTAYVHLDDVSLTASRSSKALPTSSPDALLLKCKAPLKGPLQRWSRALFWVYLYFTFYTLSLFLFLIFMSISSTGPGALSGKEWSITALLWLTGAKGTLTHDCLPRRHAKYLATSMEWALPNQNGCQL